MATAYSTSVTNETTFSTGPIAVNSYSRLWINFNTTDIEYDGAIAVSISRLNAFDELNPLIMTQLSAGLQSLDVGAGFSYPLVFGDRIQIDLASFDEIGVTTTISIIGE